MAETNQLAELNFNETLIQIAREVAWEITPINEIREKFRLNEEEWETLKDNNRFNELLASERAAWLAADNTKKRVELKSAAIVEFWLLDVHKSLHDNTIPFSQRVDAAKFLAKLATIGEQKQQGNEPGERFSVTINLGADRELVFEKNKIIEATAEKSA